MLKCLNNDSKEKMRLNIIRHRQKLLQYLENTNDTVIKPKIKLISNDIKKSNLNHNVKRKTRSSTSVKQLQPNVKVKIKEEPLSNFELKQEPLPNIEIKDPGPSSVNLKKLKDQLIEEELYSSLSSEEELYNSSSSENIGDNISVGSTEHFQSPNENESKEHLVNDKNMHYSCDNDNHKYYPSTIKRKKKVLRRAFRNPQDRDRHNAKERECRNRVAKRFQTLRKCCSYLNTNRRVPSKVSILLAAKKECDLLGHFNKKLEAEKLHWIKANEILENRISELKIDGYI